MVLVIATLLGASPAAQADPYEAAPPAGYVLVRRMDSFVRWLPGASDTDPDILLLQNEKQDSPSDE